MALCRATFRGVCRGYATRLRAFDMKCSCPGCGSTFQSSQSNAPGYIPASLKSRLFMMEKPAGYAPVLASPEPRASPSAMRQSFTRLEMERLERRFGNDISALSCPALVEEEPVEKPTAYEDFVCARCHSLTHHGRASGPALDCITEPYLPLADADKRLLDSALKPKSLIVKIVDLIDFPFSFNSRFTELLGKSVADNPVLLVANKADLLPGHGSSTVTQAIASLKEHCKDLNLLDIQLISAKTGFNMDSLHRLILSWAEREKENVFLVGRTNVGKSLVFNSFLNRDRNLPVVRSTVSSVHGTTMGILRKKLANIRSPMGVKLPRDLHLFDLPGFLMPGYSQFFTEEELEMVRVTSRVKPVQHSLTSSHVGLIGGFCRIDILSDTVSDTASGNGSGAECEPVQFQLHMRSSVPYFKKSIKAVDQFIAENQGRTESTPSMLPPFHGPDRDLAFRPAIEFDLPTNDPRRIALDVVFEDGIGWISFTHPSTAPARVRISTPAGLSVKLRSPPLRQFRLT